ncbi:MAG TPA: sigma-70 family RNA polymerase sigma factor [Bryobacteraceae bacterium]|nr:sigma-70 family RNA polymerase sigma factor [Bryobacteraceae bacterium]
MGDIQTSHDVTSLLIDWSKGDRSALEELMPLVYGELRRLAGAHLRRERPSNTLQGTVLVHEAFLRLVNQRGVNWRNRAHFFGIAAQMIRRILVDHARANHAAKRGAGGVRLEIEDGMAVSSQKELDLVGLDDALNRLAAMDERQSRIVELRFFAGLSVEETAEVMGISTPTVKREWSSARAWLFRELQGRETQ